MAAEGDQATPEFGERVAFLVAVGGESELDKCRDLALAGPRLVDRCVAPSQLLQAACKSRLSGPKCLDMQHDESGWDRLDSNNSLA